MGPLNLPDLTPLFYLAIVGLIALVGGGFWLLWWLVSHLRWVW